MKKFISLGLMALISIISLSAVCVVASAKEQELSGGKVTIIYDAFGKPSDLERGWGYSALVEYGGKKILFDKLLGFSYIYLIPNKYEIV